MTTINLQSKKETYKATIPDSWDELPFSMYLQILKEGENITNLKFVSILTGLEEEVLNRCSKKEMLFLYHQLKEIFSFKRLEEIAKEPLYKFNHNGEEYSITNDLGNESIGEYESMMKLEGMIAKNQWHVFPEYLATLYRKHDEEYDYLECRKRAKAFESLPVSIFYRARNFFFLLQQASDLVSQDYGAKK